MYSDIETSVVAKETTATWKHMKTVNSVRIYERVLGGIYSVTVELRQKNASSERDDTSDKTKWIMSITFRLKRKSYGDRRE